MILAKREEINKNIFFQSLKGHTLDSLKILKYYILRNDDVIIEFCHFWNIDPNLFKNNLFTFIYLHDLGKLTKEFQNNISKGKRSSKYPHALYSFFIINKLDYTPILSSISIEALSVLAHHTQLYNGLYENYQNINRPTFLIDEINKFLIKLNKINPNQLIKTFNTNELKFKQLKIYKVIKNHNRKCNEFNDIFLLKSVYSYFFSILQLCDDFSSANFSKFVENSNINKKYFDNILSKPEKYVLRLNENNYIKNIFKDKTPYNYQKELFNKSPKYSLLFSPCGRGKTEASLIWALNVMKKYHKNKIVFAMPTQVTSNAMWERLCNIFGQENVGVFHGKSFIKLKNLEIFDSNKDINSETFKGNVFFKPVTVTTIDHIIYSFVHGFNQSDFALGNLQNSVIIFDEIHYYEKNTLNHLYTLFDFLRKMNIPHNLMSGTLPNFIVNGLDKYELTIDDEGLNYEPFSIEYFNKCLVNTKNFHIDENLLKEIKNNYELNYKQFFIFNTIKRSKNFYNELKNHFPNFKIILYHSQFTYSDRVKKENEIFNLYNNNECFILIATQIIEISLDISADIMYTEIAPPDALGQRGGRLNRKQEKGIFKMKIFDSENNLPYDEEIINKTKKFLKLGNISYKTFKIWCDEVYINRELEKTTLTKFFKDSVLFGNKPSDICFNEDEGNKLEIRKSNIQKIDVIPLDVYKNDENMLNVENQVKIPLWWIKNDENGKSNDLLSFYNVYKEKGYKKQSYIICSYEYTYEKGFDRNNNSIFKEDTLL